MFRESAGRFSAEDVGHMQRALALAARGRGRTHPNPMVGCVLVREGQVVGEGFHPGPGLPHAEVHALQGAGEGARGATAYVTLEPCCHWGRTPPCTGALIDAGVRRVVAAMLDPDPRVAGRGCEELRRAGITVDVGLLGAQARHLNRAYITHRLGGRPLVTLKAAMTLDGRVASARGDARWVTGEAARRHAHALRDEVDAICVGLGTVVADDPALTCRLPPDEPGGRRRDPLRVVLDSQARTPVGACLLSEAVRRRPESPWVTPAPTLVAVTHGAPADRVSALREAGAEVLVLPAADGRVALPALLAALAERGVCHLLVEGGPSVHWSFLAAGLGDLLQLYIAPKLVGGCGAPGPVGGPGLPRLADAWPVADLRIENVGEDLLLTGDLQSPAGEERS